jgi:hypothetical protein
MWLSFILTVALATNFKVAICSDSPPGELKNPTDVGSPGLPLHLSPYELHVINELLFDLPTLKCPSIERVTAQAVKKFIEERIVDVNQNSDFLHPEFFPTYQNLVYCLEFVNTPKSPSNIQDTRAQIEVENHKFNKQQTEIQVLVEKFREEVLLERLKPNQRRRKHVDSKKPSKFFNTAWDWVTNIIYGPKKSAEEMEEEKWAARKKELKKKEELALGDFQMLASMLSRVVMNTCPVKYKPDHTFITKAIEEIIAAVSSDRKTLAAAADFYFVKHGLWGQVRKCTMETEKSSKSTNSLDSDTAK